MSDEDGMSESDIALINRTLMAFEWPEWDDDPKDWVELPGNMMRHLLSAAREEGRQAEIDAKPKPVALDNRDVGWTNVPIEPTEEMIDAPRGLIMYFKSMHTKWTLGQHSNSSGYGETYAHLLTEQEKAATHFSKAHQADLIWRAMVAARPKMEGEE